VIDTQELQTQHGLDRAMRSVLLQLELASNGVTASYNSAGGGGEKTAVLPAGTGGWHLYWRDEYARQTDNTGRARTLQGAEDELKLITGRYQRQPTTGETQDEQVARMLRETEGWTPEQVEQSSWRTSPRVLRRARISDDRDPNTGYRVTLRLDEDAAPADRAREMKSKGMSLRQIGLALGKDKQQIQRWLGKAA
jgi:hypothetical protein